MRMLIASCFVVQQPLFWYRSIVETTYVSTNNELSHIGYLSVIIFEKPFSMRLSLLLLPV